MNLTTKLAWRIFKSKRAYQTANIISSISMWAIGITAAAMIVILSVFNGMEGVIKDLYLSFYSDVKITPARGKFFELNSPIIQKISHVQGVTSLAPSIEDMALAEGADHQRVVKLKGIDAHWAAINSMDKDITAGDIKSIFTIRHDEGEANAIVGFNIAAEMGIDLSLQANMEGFTLYYPRAAAATTNNATDALNELNIMPVAIFRSQPEFDNAFVLTNLAQAQAFFDQAPNAYSAIDLQLSNEAYTNAVILDVKKILGGNFKVESRYEQNKALYLLMSSEKWAVFSILFLVLIIASFNLLGSLSLLVIQKKMNISILKSMGLKDILVRNVFIKTSMILSLIGGGIGILLGTIICLFQQKYGWVKLGDGFLIDAYPVSIHWQDYILVIITITLVSFLTAIYPALRAQRQIINIHRD